MNNIILILRSSQHICHEQVVPREHLVSEFNLVLWSITLDCFTAKMDHFYAA